MTLRGRLFISGLVPCYASALSLLYFPAGLCWLSVWWPQLGWSWIMKIVWDVRMQNNSRGGLSMDEKRFIHECALVHHRRIISWCVDLTQQQLMHYILDVLFRQVCVCLWGSRRFSRSSYRIITLQKDHYFFPSPAFLIHLSSFSQRVSMVRAVNLTGLNGSQSECDCHRLSVCVC